MAAFGGGAFGGPAPAAAATSHNPNNDVEVQNAATDGISCIAWSPTSNYLVAGSWDNQIRVWDVQMNGQAVPKAAVSHDGPILCAGWSNDGARVFTGGADKTAKVWDLATSSHTQVAAHDAPIKNIFWVQEMQCVVTSSWDRTVKYWDGKSPQPKGVLQLPERAYAMDIRYPLMVIATADRKIVVVHMSKPTEIMTTIQSPLKYQSRCIAAFPDMTVRRRRRAPTSALTRHPRSATRDPPPATRHPPPVSLAHAFGIAPFIVAGLLPRLDRGPRRRPSRE